MPQYYRRLLDTSHVISTPRRSCRSPGYCIGDEFGISDQKDNKTQNETSRGGVEGVAATKESWYDSAVPLAGSANSLVLAYPGLNLGQRATHQQLGAVGLGALPTGEGAGKRPAWPAHVSIADGQEVG